MTRQQKAMRQTLTTILALFALLAIVAHCTGCHTDPKPPADPACEPVVYGAGLTSCTAISTTLRDSVACENYWRLRCGRPLRVLPGDAGVGS